MKSPLPTLAILVILAAALPLRAAPSPDPGVEVAMQATLAEINAQFRHMRVQTMDWPDELLGKLGELKRTAFLARPRSKPTGQLPLLISLHGGGGKNWNLNEQLERSAQVKGLYLAERAGRDLFLFEPNSSGDWDPVTLNIALDHLLAQYPQIDRNRIYVMGHSMGGRGTWDWILGSPERFAAAAPCGFSGSIDGDPIERILSLPLWAMVGGNDGDRVSHIQTIVTTLRQAGHPHVGFTAFPGANHPQGNAAVFSSIDLVDWMLTHSKAKAPAAN